jgi:hypothetical protein
MFSRSRIQSSFMIVSLCRHSTLIPLRPRQLPPSGLPARAHDKLLPETPFAPALASQPSWRQISICQQVMTDPFRTGPACELAVRRKMGIQFAFGTFRLKQNKMKAHIITTTLPAAPSQAGVLAIVTLSSQCVPWAGMNPTSIILSIKITEPRSPQINGIVATQQTRTVSKRGEKHNTALLISEEIRIEIPDQPESCM